MSERKPGQYARCETCLGMGYKGYNRAGKYKVGTCRQLRSVYVTADGSEASRRDADLFAEQCNILLLQKGRG